MPVPDELSSFEAMNAQVASQPSPGADVGEMMLPCGRHKPVHVRILLKDHVFRILSRVRYEFEVDGELRARHTENGIIDEPVSADATGATLTAWLNGDQAPPQIWDLQIAALDPIGLDEGVGARMFNLGLIDDAGDLPAAGLAAERKALQYRFDQPVSSVVDQGTRTTVESLHSADLSLGQDEKVWQPPIGLGQYLTRLDDLIKSFGGPDGHQ